MATGLQETFQEIGTHAAEALSRAISDVAHGGLDKFVNEEQLRAATRRIEASVRAHPWPAMAVALLLGLCVGAALRTAAE